MKANWLDANERTGQEIEAATLDVQGVMYKVLDTDPAEYREPLDTIKRVQGYIQEDQIELTPNTPNLDEICAKFVDEHYHDEDEVRFVLDGEGIFDIRSKDDRWMRVVVETGDLIIVPAGRHHRHAYAYLYAGFRTGPERPDTTSGAG